MSKYRNIKTRGFDSKREAAYYDTLLMRCDTPDTYNRVVSIEKQVKYVLMPSQRDAQGNVLERPCTYIADFRVTYADGRVEVIDVKGMKTEVYKIKRKLMLFVHGIKIREV